MSSAWAKGSTTAWRRLRLVVLTRDRYTCQRPDAEGRPCGKPATDVGHIDDLATTGGPIIVDPSRLRAECAPCNRGAGARLGNALRTHPTHRRWHW